MAKASRVFVPLDEPFWPAKVGDQRAFLASGPPTGSMDLWKAVGGESQGRISAHLHHVDVKRIRRVLACKGCLGVVHNAQKGKKGRRM